MADRCRLSLIVWNPAALDSFVLFSMSTSGPREEKQLDWLGGWWNNINESNIWREPALTEVPRLCSTGSDGYVRQVDVDWTSPGVSCQSTAVFKGPTPRLHSHWAYIYRGCAVVLTLPLPVNLNPSWSISGLFFTSISVIITPAITHCFSMWVLLFKSCPQSNPCILRSFPDLFLPQELLCPFFLLNQLSVKSGFCEKRE